VVTTTSTIQSFLLSEKNPEEKLSPFQIESNIPNPKEVLGHRR